MLAPRPTKLRSQRDINLWRFPLQLSLAAVALFGITLIPVMQRAIEYSEAVREGVSERAGLAPN
jgi:hypothetical protein